MKQVIAGKKVTADWLISQLLKERKRPKHSHYTTRWYFVNRSLQYCLGLMCRCKFTTGTNWSTSSTAVATSLIGSFGADGIVCVLTIRRWTTSRNNTESGRCRDTHQCWRASLVSGSHLNVTNSHNCLFIAFSLVDGFPYSHPFITSLQRI